MKFGQCKSPWRDDKWILHSQYLLNSYAQLLGRELIDRAGTLETQAQRLFEAPFIIVSHDTQKEPILNYGNAKALSIWQLSLPKFLQTPSRQTAESVHQNERAKLLKQTLQQGFIDNYRGIRITSTGRRFLIKQATVWNLTDTTNRLIGQAATFATWDYLND